jgi:hypothetical protein
MDKANIPAVDQPGFLEWLAGKLGVPFALPKLALPQTIKNGDKAFGRLLAAGLDNASGRIERNTAIREVKTEADLTIIRSAAAEFAAQLKTDPALAERALDYTFKDSILKQSSRERVGRLALEHLNAQATMGASSTKTAGPDASAEIDDDWLNAFSEHVGGKSNADIQALWAKILANEIRKPRSFSLQSLRLLADLSANDARLIHDNILPLVVSGHMIFSQGIPDLTDFITAEELGVLSGASSPGLNWNVTIEPGKVILPVGGKSVVAEAETKTRISIPSIPLTRFGSELRELSNDYPDPSPEYLERIVKFFGNHGLKAHIE